MKPDFQKILNHFKGELAFKALTETTRTMPDEVVYAIETNQGTYYIVQTDIVTSFENIVLLIKDRTERFSHFVEPKVPLKDATKYYIPDGNSAADFEQYLKYVDLAEGKAFGEWLTFLIKK